MQLVPPKFKVQYSKMTRLVYLDISVIDQISVYFINFLYFGMSKKILETDQKAVTDGEDKITEIHQGKKVTDFWSTPLFSSISYSYLHPLLDEAISGPEAKLHLEQFGDLAEDQKLEGQLKELTDSWSEVRKTEMTKEVKNRDRDAYFKNLFWTFRADFLAQFLFRMAQLGFEFGVVQLSQEFFSYLEKPVDPADKGDFYKENKGWFLLLGIIAIKWPKQILDEKFYNVLCSFLQKIIQVQKAMLYDKNLRVSPATNKSISQGKFLNIVNTDCSCHWGCFWMGAEILKATLVLFMCTYSLYLKVGYACFLTFVFIGAKVSIDLLTRKWRESTWKKVGKASDERASEINEAFKNAKTLKLYSWESIFVDRIKAKRSRQERLIYKGELKNLLNHMFHSLFGQMMRPTIIACALYLGRELDLSTTLATIMMIDWIAWPLHMLPNFMHNIRETKRAMRRIQKVLMLDEIQEGAKEVSAEPQWSKPALEIKGNFTWGFINKAEDQDSDDDAADTPKEEGKDKEAEKNQTVKSKITLKNIDLSIDQGNFVCIIGGVGSGKTSLLNAIIGEMIAVSPDSLKDMGGIDKELSPEKFAEWQSKMLNDKKHAQNVIQQRGSISFVEQNYWIQNMTIRENILFGLPMNEDKYVRTILSCCLQRDFEILTAGDRTEIGEKGINLSGGQKARVSLARAVYADKDIILMDDPISALDANVRKKIFKRGFKEMLNNKTRVLVTHSIDFLHLADKIIVMKDGEIAAQGEYDDLQEHPIVKEIIDIHNKNKDASKGSTQEAESRADDTANERAPESETEELEDPNSLNMMKKHSTLAQLTPQIVARKMLLFAAGKHASEKGKVGEPMEAIVDQTVLDGDKQVTVSHKAGQVTLVTFWGTRSNPSQVLMKRYQNIDFGDKLRIVGLCTDAKKEKFISMIKEKQWNKVEHYWSGDGAKTANKAYAVTELPHTLLVDTEGKIVFVGDPEDRDLQKDIGDLLQKKQITGKGTSEGDDGKLVKDTDDDKTELKSETLKVAMDLTGGMLFWVIFVSSFVATKFFSKYREYQVINKENEKQADLMNHLQMVVIEVSFEITRWFILCIIGARLSRSLHNSLVTKVMNSPVYMYFSVTPLGKLLKHFTKDVDNCDRDFFGTMEWIIRSLVDCLFKIGFALVFSPYLGIMAMMNFVGMREIYNYTKEGNTEFRRIQSKQDTKMSTHSNETADGMTIIRAFSKQGEFTTKARSLSNNCLLATIMADSCHFYFQVRVFSLSNAMFMAAGASCMYLKGSISPIFLVMMFKNCEGVNNGLCSLLHGFKEMKEKLISMQKLMNLKDIIQEQETFAGVPVEKELESWPSKGEIVFKDMDLRYKEGDLKNDLTLSKLNFRVEPGHKVGVVGRTGAGKSTLGAALSRIIELAGGQILIDGKSIAGIPMHILRQNITVIPQDPVIFTGTIKFNLDPKGNCSDEECEKVLKQAGLDDLLTRVPEKTKADEDENEKDKAERGNGKGIYFKLEGDGSALSSGEKQLICICRAVLRKNKIVVLDEATANIDIVTEEKIQKLIESAFKQSTVFTIAHRINTIINSDKVLLLEAGEKVEYDDPKILRADPHSELSKLITEIKKEGEQN